MRPRLALAAAAATSLPQAVWRGRSRLPAWGRGWDRTNHRGEPISLVEGPAVVAGVVAGVLVLPVPARVKAAAVVAAGGAGAVGLLDDLAENTTEKGLKGHLSAAAHGRVTTGLVKIGGIAAAGVGAGYLLVRGGAVDRLLGAAVIAASANLVNLFDLRPGRAVKVVLLAGAAQLARGGDGAVLVVPVAAASASVLPVDLGERAMMGDAGANALGAVLAVAYLAGGPSRSGVAVSLAALVGLTLASERVSFTRVIEATPGLRELDRWGRRR